MFGKKTTTGDVFSEDEDWGPPKKRSLKECDAASTLMTLCESDANHSDLQNLEVEKNHLPNSKTRKPPLRIPSDAVQKLRQAFAENELPSETVKKEISELVGFEYEKVNKWFKNARYSSLKNRKHKERASDSSPSNTSDSEADKTAEANVSKSSSPTSTLKLKRLKKVSWNTNLTTLIRPLKRRRFKKTSLSITKANLEPSDDDMSLKKLLLRVKAKNRHKKRVGHDTKLLQEESAERQMEQLCRLEAKLWKLKQILSTIENPETNKSNELFLKENVVYVSIAVLKEKL